MPKLKKKSASQVQALDRKRKRPASDEDTCCPVTSLPSRIDTEVKKRNVTSPSSRIQHSPGKKMKLEGNEMDTTVPVPELDPMQQLLGAEVVRQQNFRSNKLMNLKIGTSTSEKTVMNQCDKMKTQINCKKLKHRIGKALEQKTKCTTRKEQERLQDRKRKEQTRQAQSLEQKRLDRIKDQSRKADSRKSRSEEEKTSDRIKDTGRKEDSRKSRSEEEKTSDRIKDTGRKDNSRKMRSEGEKTSDRLTNQNRMADCRKSRSEEEKTSDRIKDTGRKEDSRKRRSEEEKTSDRIKDTGRKDNSRKMRSEGEKTSDRLTNQNRMADCRKSRSEEEKTSDRIKDTGRKEDSRKRRSEEEKTSDRIKDTGRKDNSRKMRSEGEKTSDRLTNQNRMADCRKSRSEEEKTSDRIKDTGRKDNSRKMRSEGEKTSDRLTNQNRMADCRKSRSEEEKTSDRIKDTGRKEDSRKSRSEEEKTSDRLRNQNRMADKRTPSTYPAEAISVFKAKIQDGPTYICTSCNRLLYRTSVSIFKPEDFEETKLILMKECRTKKLSFDNCEYICITCKNALKKNVLPSISVGNGLNVDEIPQELDDLSPLEVMFIAKRIPFMKLLGLPRGKQKAIHGCVVNVPVEPEQSVSVLPRIPSPDCVIPVKLKRKLMYRGHVIMQNIRPFKIMQALSTLKFGIHNPHYQDVIINDNWQQQSQDLDPELWNYLAANEGHATDVGQEEQGDDVEEECSEDNSEHVQQQEDVRSKLSGIPFDTCIQPKDFTADNNLLLTIAPGEGKKPKAFETDDLAEELSFPQLFPTGKFGFSMKRNQKLSPKKYFQTRILNCDGRFARSLEYIFYAQYRTEAKEVASCLSIALRKGNDTNVTARDLKEKVTSVIQSDLGIHFLQKVRGSPSFFNKMLYDLLGMIRHLGACTWFITLSAADLKWMDTLKIISQQQGKLLSDEDIKSLSWEQRCDLLRSNPITAARHFDHRVQLFLKHIVLNKALKPLGHITDYKYRIEFQQRGSPHIHMLAWVKDAPTFENNTEQEITDFIDNNISCSLPTDDDQLCELLNQVQRHTHSVACRKHGQSCRFNFPRPPMTQTLAVKPPTDEVPQEKQDFYRETLTSVLKELDAVHLDADPSLDTLLTNVNVLEADYVNALKWIKTKNGQPAIILRRSPSEVAINNYNRVLMEAWEANLDIQFVTNVYACVMYVASYISKSEKSLGDLLKSVSTAGVHLGPKASMRQVAKKFLSHREVSGQEAAVRLLGLPLTQGSRQVVYIPTGLPETRTRLFKPMSAIVQLDDEDSDVYLKGVLDKYAARPSKLKQICLADFASRYTYATKKQKSDTVVLEDPDDESEDDGNDEQLPKCIALNNNLGQMSLRHCAAIPRYHQFSEQKEPEQYYHSQLLLYYPWQEEEKDLCQNTFQDSYFDKVDVISENRDRFEHHAEEVGAAMDNLAEAGPPEDSWAQLAPQSEQMRQEDQEERTHADKDNALAAFDTFQETHAARDLGLVPHEYELSTETLTTQDWYNMVLSLNAKQSDLHSFIVKWCTSMLHSHRTETPDPFYIFLTGGAGVGKSHLVRTIVQTVKRMLSRNYQAMENHIMVCAPTGPAAFNIAGYTLHSLFHLPVFESSYDDYIPLSSEKRTALKETVGEMKILVIDEVSMVGSDMLLTVHRRLCDIMGSHEPFGGISVIAVGDLLQLPPVAKAAVFSMPSDEMAAIYGSLWQTHFQIFQLTDIVRQKDDQQFATLLYRLRTADSTGEDLDILRSRITEPGTNAYPPDTTHIFAFNRDVDAHNRSMLGNLPGPVFTFTAVDSKRDTQTGRIQTEKRKESSGGLPNQVNVALHARVMLVKNIDVSDGLVNSAAGIVTGFLPDPPSDQDSVATYRPKFILVRFDNDRVGKKARLAYKGILPDDVSTPVPDTETPVRLGKNTRVTGTRKQFPLALAWAVTIHKEQGKTEETLVVSSKGSFRKGQFYTAISRTKSLDGLFILGEISDSKIKPNQQAIQEIARMERDSPFKLPSVPSLTANPEIHLKIAFLNTNSLHAHVRSVQNDSKLLSAHIICLVETWFSPADPSPVFPDFTDLRQDSINQGQRRSGGLLVYIHSDFHILKYFTVPNNNIEHIVAFVSPRWAVDLRICILTVYKKPTITGKQFLKSMESILSTLPISAIPTIVTGDFNVDFLSKQKSALDLARLTRYYGLHQYVKTPTHRSGSLLDQFYVNRHSADIQTDVNPVYYSDHSHISAAIPYPILHH